MEKILDRFLRYVAVDTQSNEESESQPSAEKELNLLRMLRDELQALGVEATLDEWGYVMGTIPSNIDRKVPVVGFIAHVDTAPDASGAGVKPQIIPDYDGSDVPLKGVPGLVLKTAEFPELLAHRGETLVTTDGTTLLGADDKAGVAEIMDTVQYIMAHPEFRHGEIKIGFTPDEEIGRGVVKFDVAKFGADYGYTMDGGEVGELEFENFNAASASVHIQGSNVHPGYAKGKMRNALHIAQEFDALLPVSQRPEYTQDYEGFFHLTTTARSSNTRSRSSPSAPTSSTPATAKARPPSRSKTNIIICASRWSRTTTWWRKPSRRWRWPACSRTSSPSAAAPTAPTFLSAASRARISSRAG